jgi:hypothetical protein
MEQPFDLETARRQLEELGRRIEEGRAGLRPGRAAEELDRDWRKIHEQHQQISRRLAAGMAPGSAAAEMMRADIDELRHGFTRWAARVERRFREPASPPTRKPLGWD